MKKVEVLHNEDRRGNPFPKLIIADELLVGTSRASVRRHPFQMHNIDVPW